MTSRISLQNPDRRAAQGVLVRGGQVWPVVTVWIAALLFYAVGTPLRIIYTRTGLQIPADSPENIDRITRALARDIFQFGYLSAPAALLTAILALMLAVQGFSWLFSRQEEDFYLSQPVTRAARFARISCGGFVTWAVPFTVSALVGDLIGFSMHAMNREGLMECIYGMFRMDVFFLAVYAVAVLAVMLSGRILFALLTALFLFAAEGAGAMLVSFLRATYLVTFYGGKEAWYDTYRVVSSPFFAFVLGRHRIRDLFLQDQSDPNGIRQVLSADRTTLLWMALIAAAAFLIAFFLFRIRKSESAGRTILFRPFQLIVRVYFSAFAAALLAVVADEAFSGAGRHVRTLIMLLVLFVTGFLTAGLLEAVIRSDIRKFFRRWPEMAASMGTALFLIAAFRWDLFGYDLYIPSARSVADAGIYLNYQNYNDASLPAGVLSQRTMHITDYEAVEKLARAGQQHLVEEKQDQSGRTSLLAGLESSFGIYSADTASSSGTEEDGFPAVVAWHLLSGKTVYRKILVPYTVDSAVMNPVLSDSGYQSSRFDLDGAAGTADAKDLLLSYSNGLTTVRLSDTAGLMQEFQNAYRTDLIQYNYSFVRDNDVCGRITWTSGGSWFNYDVYPSYTNTIGFLKKYSAWIDPLPKVTEIRRADVVRTIRSAGRQEDSLQISFSSSDRIETLLTAAVNRSFSSDWKKQADLLAYSDDRSTVTKYTLNLNMKSDPEDTDSISLSLDPELLPAFCGTEFDRAQARNAL